MIGTAFCDLLELFGMAWTLGGQMTGMFALWWVWAFLEEEVAGFASVHFD